jgi:hypothetical protein
MINSVVESDTLAQRFARHRIRVLQPRSGGRNANNLAERRSLGIRKGMEWYEANLCVVLCGSIHRARSCVQSFFQSFPSIFLSSLLCIY